MVVVWSISAKSDLKNAFNYIAIDSRKNAEIVRDTLITLTIDLANNPEKHPLDKFKTKNDRIWRAFEKYQYRISYRVLEHQIRIVRMRIQASLRLNFNRSQKAFLVFHNSLNQNL